MKRAFDVVVALLGLTFGAPVLLLLATGVALNLGRPVLFKQKRPGRCGTPFVLIKFRTMRDALGPDGTALSDEARLTKFGKFLRSTSLDELPELWNVLTGEMSLVGPRPLLMEYLPLYSVDQARRHDVRPGITGWAQVNGRNALSWPERFGLDLWYVEHMSFGLDLRILCLTVWRVIRREGVNQPGQATMETFRGNGT